MYQAVGPGEIYWVGMNYIQWWGLGNIRTFAFWGRMLGPETVCFLLFGGFLMYSGSISFRELKNAKKFLCLLEGVGAKIILLLKKKNGEEYWSGGRAWRDNLGRRELYTGVGVGHTGL